MGAALKLGVVALLTASAFGDASLAALIGGAFACTNTILLVGLRRRHDEMRDAITADRRIVYDQKGRPIGTVLDLRAGGGWEQWRLQAKRRHDDDEPADA